MKALVLLIAAMVSFTNAYGIYVKTYLKGNPDPNKTCCIALVHLYFTNAHEYVAMGTSLASLDDALCCEKEATGVDLDLKSISQFQKDSLDAVYAFNASDAFKQSVNQVVLKYRLTREGKTGKIEVAQNPVSGKLVLSFTAEKAGTMNLSVEPMNNKNYFTDVVEVKEGKNEIEINYVPYAGERSQTPLTTYTITLINDNAVFGVIYRHQFR